MVPYAPAAHYHLSERRNGTTPESSAPIAINLQDEIGRQLTGASFTEVGLNEREWELGDQVRVNDRGRLSRIKPGLMGAGAGGMVTFEEEVEVDIVEIDVVGVAESDSGTAKPTRPSVSFEEGPSIKRPSHRPGEPEEAHNTVAFPTYPVPYPSNYPATTFPPYPHPYPHPQPMPVPLHPGSASSPYGYSYPSNGLGGLATLEESEEEYESDDEGDRFSESTETPAPRTVSTSENEDGRRHTMTPDTPITPARRISREQRRASLDRSIVVVTPVPDINSMPLIESDSDDEELYLSSRALAIEIEEVENTRRLSLSSRRSQPKSRTTKVSKGSSEEPLSPFHHYQPTLRPIVTEEAVTSIYAEIRERRSELKALNHQIGELQIVTMSEVGEGKGSKGLLIVGKGVRHISGSEPILGRTKDDLRWDQLTSKEPQRRRRDFWIAVTLLSVTLSAFREVFVLSTSMHARCANNTCQSFTSRCPFGPCCFASTRIHKRLGFPPATPRLRQNPARPRHYLGSSHLRLDSLHFGNLHGRSSRTRQRRPVNGRHPSTCSQRSDSHFCEHCFFPLPCIPSLTVR